MPKPYMFIAKAMQLIFLFISLWIIITYTGMRLPYLYTEFSFQLRAYLLFPLMLVITGYLIFIQKPSGRSDTRYMLRMKSLPSNSERFKSTLLLLIGWILVVGGGAWTSVASSAWVAMLFGSKSYVDYFVISSIQVRGSVAWRKIYDLNLIDEGSHKVVLPLTGARYERNHWREGERLCIKGRKSIFGTIVDSEYRPKNACGPEILTAKKVNQ